MSWKEKAVAVYQRFGPPVKFAARQVVGGLAPGGPAVVDLLGQALDCVYRTSRNALDIDEVRIPSATAADLTRVEALLDVLGGDLAGLTEQAAALEGLPDAATKILDVALRTDDRCRVAVRNSTPPPRASTFSASSTGKCSAFRVAGEVRWRKSCR